MGLNLKKLFSSFGKTSGPKSPVAKPPDCAPVSGDTVPLIPPVWLRELMGGALPEAEEVRAAWRNSRACDSLRAIPGKADGMPFGMDIHEKGLGPHGLISAPHAWETEGMLSLLLVSLAAQYSPDELNILCMTGDAPQAVTSLPHCIPCPAAGEDAAQALKHLQDMLMDRATRLKKANAYSRDNYMKKRETDGSAPPMPVLIVVAHRFDLHFAAAPAAERLLMLVRAGRSMSVHLLLTMASETCLTDMCASNISFRISPCENQPEAPDLWSVSAVGSTRRFRTLLFEQTPNVHNHELESLAETIAGAWATPPAMDCAGKPRT